MKARKYFLWLPPLLLLVWSLGWYVHLFGSLQLFANAQLAGYKAPDAITYEKAAEKFYLQGLEADLLRTPVCPIVYGWPLLFNVSANNWQQIICVIHALCWLGCTLLMYYLLRQKLKTLFAVSGAMLFTLQVGLVALANELLSEILFTTLLTAYAALFFGVVVNSKQKWLPWLGLCAAMLTLTRPTFYILFVLQFAVVLTFFVITRLRNKSVSGTALYLKTIAFMLVPLLLHMANMKRSTGYFTLSAISSRAYYVFMGAKMACYESNGNVWLERNRRDKTIDTLPELQRQHFTDSSARADFKHHLLHQTGTWLAVWKNNLLENGNSGSANIQSLTDVGGHDPEFEQRKQTYFDLSETQNTWHTRMVLVLPVLWALLFVFRRKDTLRLYGLLLSLIGFAIVALSAFSFWQGDRFHVVVWPLTCISLCLLLYTLLHKVSPPVFSTNKN